MTVDEPPARRSLVAVAYGPRSVAPLQIAAAAAGVCDLMWIIDARKPEMEEMSALLRRFGAVVDIGGLDRGTAAREVGAYRPDGIVTYFDADMIGIAEIADELRLPFVSPAVARTLVDKLYQREALHAAQLGGPRYWAIPSGPADASLSVVDADVQWPVVLKPRSETGSNNTFLAKDADAVRGLLDAMGDGRPEMMLEEYLSDDPSWACSAFADYVSVESIVAHGVISHIAVTGRFPQAETFRETGFCIPAQLDDADQDAVLELATAAIAALGVDFGCLHTEIKFTRDGPRLIEVNGRIGFGIPAMLDKAAAFPMLETSLRVALGEHVVLAGPIECSRVGYRLFLQPPAIIGKVQAIDGLGALADHEGVETVQVHRGPGWSVDWREGTRTFVLAVVGAAKDHREVEEIRRLLNDDIEVSYE